ncbi:thermonuclease family protein [Microvirga calopogonii]|uniref:thermonuclease family protein n=1 Tax=Microvirga calopogonii TaxID=2078013 RepID=UPI000E0DB344|nr:thermonuclease family protein [Microvirga calopogonii]
MKSLALVAFAFPLFLHPAAAAPAISGQADVVDGDTLSIRGQSSRIRLYGVDTPEGQQTCEDAAGKRYLCGSLAAEALSALIGRNGRVTCQEQDRDRYGRIVAVCEANGREINAELVRQGWALEYKQYSDGRYAAAEAEARKAKQGLWAGKFVEPWEWRRGKRLSSEASTGADRKCAIKGNISGAGKIYHLPGTRAYDKTVINEASGERWFCTEDEARAAGWRAPRG